jgi:hypothetical protein
MISLATLLELSYTYLVLDTNSFPETITVVECSRELSYICPGSCKCSPSN